MFYLLVFDCAGSALLCWLSLGAASGGCSPVNAVPAFHFSGFSQGAWTGAGSFSTRGAPAYSSHGVWNLPGPGVEPVSPAAAGGFLTTGPPRSLGGFCMFQPPGRFWVTGRKTGRVGLGVMVPLSCRRPRGASCQTLCW